MTLEKALAEAKKGKFEFIKDPKIGSNIVQTFTPKGTKFLKRIEITE